MKTKMVIRGLALLALTYVFLVAIKLMGESLKLLGNGFAEQLISYTAFPLAGLFVGILATSIVQSSSITTSITVGLVAADALTVAGAIPIIFGANIGTSITNTIVSLGHITKKEEFQKAFSVATVHDFFNLFALLILFPLELMFHPLEKIAVYLSGVFFGVQGVSFWNPLGAAVKPAANVMQGLLGNAFVMLAGSMVLIFASLRLFVMIIRPFAEGEFRHKLKKHIFDSAARSFGFGIGLTVIAQSSSITTSLIVPLAGVGMLDVYSIFPYILGANIGTTITALLASLATGSIAALTVALVHVLFNVIGSAIIYPMRKIPISMSIWIAHQSIKSRIIPIAYIGCVFFILPMLILFLFR